MKKPPKEFCRCGEMKPIEMGSYWLYRCDKCFMEVKNYKPKELRPGEPKNFGPEH